MYKMNQEQQPIQTYANTSIIMFMRTSRVQSQEYSGNLTKKDTGSLIQNSGDLRIIQINASRGNIQDKCDAISENLHRSLHRPFW